MKSSIAFLVIVLAAASGTTSAAPDANQDSSKTAAPAENAGQAKPDQTAATDESTPTCHMQKVMKTGSHIMHDECVPDQTQSLNGPVLAGPAATGLRGMPAGSSR